MATIQNSFLLSFMRDDSTPLAVAI